MVTDVPWTAQNRRAASDPPTQRTSKKNKLNYAIMDALKDWMHRKKHNSWTGVRNTWLNIAFSELNMSPNSSSQEYQNWNPWKVWCESWKKFVSSGEEPPKSQKRKAAVFFEMFDLAKLTSDKLEEAKTMRTDLSRQIQVNESLRNYNLILNNKCAELQTELITREKMRVENLEKEAHIRGVLENQSKFLMGQVKFLEEELRQAQAKCDQLVEDSSSFQKSLVEYKAKLQMELNTREMGNKNLEKEAHLRRVLEKQSKFLTEQVKLMEEKLCQSQAKCDQLEEDSFFQKSLVEYKKNNNYEVIIKNDFHLHERNQLIPYKQLENGDGEKSLDLESIKSIVERLGRVTRQNVFKWLCSCEVEYRIWKWSEKDFEKILHRCMDSGIFSSLTPIIRMTEISWREMCKDIAERFVPDLDEALCTEKMKTNEEVLQYFSRMWTIYRFMNAFASRDDPEYIDAICNGLLPHLYVAVEHLRDEDYAVIEAAARSAEHSWWNLEQQEQHRYSEMCRAGVGCPSRVTIWRRLKENGVPHREIDGAIYWDLVVLLSRYEDLETRARRN